LRSLLESAIDPKDESEEAKAKRGFESYSEFDGLKFWAKLRVKPADAKYPASNQLAWILVPGDKDYGQTSTGNGGAAPAQGSQAMVPAKADGFTNDLDDEIPF
jgi:hypothetical protein